MRLTAGLLMLVCVVVQAAGEEPPCVKGSFVHALEQTGGLYIVGATSLVYNTSRAWQEKWSGKLSDGTLVEIDWDDGIETRIETNWYTVLPKMDAWYTIGAGATPDVEAVRYGRVERVKILHLLVDNKAYEVELRREVLQRLESELRCTREWRTTQTNDIAPASPVTNVLDLYILNDESYFE
jgi:hypothetical protein